MKKQELQDLVDIMVTNKEIEAVDGKTIQCKYGDQTFTRKVKSDSEVSQAIQEIQTEVDNYTFTQAFKPSTTDDEKADTDENETEGEANEDTKD